MPTEDPPPLSSPYISADRWHVPPRAAAAAAVLACAALLVAVAHVVLGGGGAAGSPVAAVPPRAAAVAPPTPTAALPVLPTPSGVASPSVVLVDVVGRVRRQGLVTLPAGSRVADAVRAAGGAARGADLAAVNLARRLIDGEQVLVPQPGQAAAPAGSAPAAGTGGTQVLPSNGVVDLNSATEADLDALPGVGPVLASRILAWRTEHGRFSSVDELAEVSGIGDATLARLRPLVRV